MRERDGMRTALLISGGGTTAEAVIKACREGRLEGVTPVAVIASKPDAGGIQKAEALGIPTVVVARKGKTKEEFGAELFGCLKNLGVDLVSQNGWLPLTPENVVQEYQGRIINQHPGPLDPGRGHDFGGQGMYGARVTCARIAYEWAVEVEHPWTESTVHFVTEAYDDGEVIRVSALDIPSFPRVTIAHLRNSPDQLIEITGKVQVQLLPMEHENVIAVLREFAEGLDIIPWRRTLPLIASHRAPLLREAKKLAVELFLNG